MCVKIWTSDSHTGAEPQPSMCQLCYLFSHIYMQMQKK